MLAIQVETKMKLFRKINTKETPTRIKRNKSPNAIHLCMYFKENNSNI